MVSHKPSLRLLLLLLGFSYVLLSVAIPTTRSLKSLEENPSSVQPLMPQDAMELGESEELFGMGQGYIEGRMDMDNTVDYPGTGANNHHDPKTPGRA